MRHITYRWDSTCFKDPRFSKIQKKRKIQKKKREMFLVCFFNKWDFGFSSKNEILLPSRVILFLLIILIITLLYILYNYTAIIIILSSEIVRDEQHNRDIFTLFHL
jgi:hypothetical protein